MDNVEKFINEIKAYDVGFDKIRLGSKHDGGYVVLRELCKATDLVYSFGIGDNISFELDFANNFPWTQLKLFDPMINKIPQQHKNFTFIKEGIGNNYGNFNKMSDIHTNALLKMDIEWDEWDALDNLNIKTLKRFTQMVIEFHIIHVEPRSNLTPYFLKFYKHTLEYVNDYLFGIYYRVMKKLNIFFNCFHIHANNSLPLISIDEYRIPPLLEMSFVRRDLVSSIKEIKESFPVKGLDFSNKIDRPDINNYYPLRKHDAG